MKKIGLIYTGMNFGGAQRVLVDLAIYIKNFDITPIVITDSGPMIEELKLNGITHYQIPLKSKRPDKVLYCISSIIKIIKNEKIDLVHSHHRFTTAVLKFICFFNSIPLVHTEHNVFPDKHFINLRGKNIIAVSNEVRENLIKNHVQECDITVIQNGIKIDFKKSTYNLREELNVDNNTILVGVLARLVKEKGHEFLLNSVSQTLITNDKLKLIFIGDGEERTKLESLVAEMKISDRVIFLGNRSDVNQIIDSFNFFILPSFYEGLPMSILEIMSKSKILIATNVGGNKEVISNNENGFLVESGNEKKLNEVVKYCLNNIEQLTRLERNAASTIKERFSINRVCKEHSDYYLSVINNFNKK